MTNYFEFYDIPVTFSVEEAQIRRIYLRNSKKYHPDFFTLESEAKQAEVLELSTINNEAFKILSDVDKRMHYILQLKGILDEEGKNQIPQNFLMEVMDINEAIMELQMDFDQSSYDQSIQQLEQMENQLYEVVRPILESYTDSSGSAADLHKIKNYYLKKRYLLRIRENLNKFASL